MTLSGQLRRYLKAKGYNSKDSGLIYVNGNYEIWNYPEEIIVMLKVGPTQCSEIDRFPLITQEDLLKTKSYIDKLGVV